MPEPGPAGPTSAAGIGEDPTRVGGGRGPASWARTPDDGAVPAGPESETRNMAIALLLILLGVWLIAQALGGNLAARLIGQA